MTKTAAQVLGGLFALLLAFAWLVKTRVHSCPGSVFFEFAPPLLPPGPYAFEFRLDDGRRCRFAVKLPVRGKPDKGDCPFAVRLHTQGRVAASSITGLTLAGTPSRVDLNISKHNELLYSGPLEPKYREFPERSGSTDPFCGERALVKPRCFRGSSQCVPFATICDGPEDCPGASACCVSPEAGYRYGAKAASECKASKRCLDSFFHIACHADSNCPEGMHCTNTDFSNDFAPPVFVCRRGDER